MYNGSPQSPRILASTVTKTINTGLGIYESIQAFGE